MMFSLFCSKILKFVINILGFDLTKRRIFSEMTIDTHDYTGFYTIVLTEHSDDCEETITKIFADCWSLYIANVNILTPSEDYETILLYTYFPFAPDHCEAIVPVVVDYFENFTFVLNAPVFPDKFQNFYKCPLRISTYTLPPFMMLTTLSNGTIRPDGIEGILFRVISQRLNFTPIIIQSAYNVLKNITNPKNKLDAQSVKPKLPRSLTLVSIVHFYQE